MLRILTRSAAPPASSGSTVVLSRRVFLGVASLSSAAAIWAAAMTGYLLFQDEFGAILLRRQAEMQYAYEDRIAALRTQLERTTSQDMVERRRLEARIARVAARQTQIEAQQSLLSLLAEQTGAPAAPTRAAAGAPAAKATIESAAPGPAPAKPLPLGEEGIRRDQQGADAAAASGPLAASGRLSAIEQSLERVAADQVRVLAGLHGRAERHLALLDDTLESTGLATDRLKPAKAAAPQGEGVGGPYVALPPGPTASPFDRLSEELQSSILRFDRLRQVARSLPLTRPVAGTLEPTSRFGYRVDPFTHGGALHTGIDLRAEHGTEVRATGPGRITLAEASGGYGNMVEIDHGNGVTTRYAHLSAIVAAPGQQVETGTIIGHVGSTGRSTGSHLHYETRINGEAVDPQRFLRAGAVLARGTRFAQSISSTSAAPP
jgi:murein DD-endopeptidase MepM/ murein hydrolase activator NlpD